MTDLAAAAREAYLSGWALTQGPLTVHARAGYAAAVALALENALDPGILEVTLDLGKLEGTWKTVYDRREDLTQAHITRITKVWRKLIRRIGTRDFVARYRRQSAIYSPVEASDPGKKWRQDEAAAAALAWLHQILTTPGYDDLTKAVADAMAAAEAEGKTAALAVAADMAKKPGFDWTAAYKAMQASLNDLGRIPSMAAQWVRDMLSSAASAVGRVLVRGSGSGASEDEMAAAVGDAVGGEDVPAVAATVDQAMGSSMVQAALDLYTDEGVQQVQFLTAADERVCDVCQGYEDSGPYSPDQFPECPAHFGCRCCSAPVDNLPISAFADYLTLIP